MKDKDMTREETIKELEKLRLENASLQKLINKNNINQKHAEQSISESAASLDYAQEIAKMGDWQYDVINQKTRWSRNCYVIFGLEPFELEPTYEYFKSRIHHDDLCLLEEGFERIIK